LQDGVGCDDDMNHDTLAMDEATSAVPSKAMRSDHTADRYLGG